MNSNIKIWKEITAEFIKKVKKPSDPLSFKPVQVKLVKVTGYELGFKKSASLRDILKAATQKGLKQLNGITGNSLCTAYDETCKGWLYVGGTANVIGGNVVVVIAKDNTSSEVYLRQVSGFMDSTHSPTITWLFQI